MSLPLAPRIGRCIDCGCTHGPWGLREGDRGMVCEWCLDCPGGHCVARIESIRYSHGYAEISPGRREWDVRRVYVVDRLVDHPWRILVPKGVWFRAVRNISARRLPKRFATFASAQAFVLQPEVAR